MQRLGRGLEEDADESSFHTFQGNQHIPPILGKSWKIKSAGDCKGYMLVPKGQNSFLFLFRVFFCFGFLVLLLCCFIRFMEVVCLQRWDSDDAGFASFQDKPIWMELFSQESRRKKTKQNEKPYFGCK